MNRLRAPIRLYVVGVVATAAAALAAAFLMTPLPGTGPLLALALLAIATAAQIQVVHLSAKTKISVGDSAIFAAILLVPPPVAMAIGGISTFVGLRVATKQTLYNRLFNAAGTVLAVGAAAGVYRGLARGPQLLDDPAAIGLGAAACYLVKATITDVVIALQMHRDPRSGWWGTHRREIWHHGALFLLGVLAAVSAQRQAWTLALFLVPAAVILLQLREATKLRQRTKDAIVELADLIDKRDPYTFGHSQRVAELSRQVARRLRLPAQRVELITEAARMHDIGKISTPDRILKKPGPLTEQEWTEMRRHCEAGHRFLQRLPDFAEGSELVLSHHERIDGDGYPRHLKGIELPLEASIIAVCDAYDAMTSDRVYRPALPHQRVIEELHAGRGTQWDERAVDAILALVDEGALAAAPLPASALTAG